MELRGGNYLREELKKGNLTWTEDDRYTANADGLQLEHWVDNPWDGAFVGIATGDTCEDLLEELDCEGLFYQLFDTQCGARLGYGIIDAASISEDIVWYESSSNLVANT